jgi:hypothetical protein
VRHDLLLAQLPIPFARLGLDLRRLDPGAHVLRHRDLGALDQRAGIDMAEQLSEPLLGVLALAPDRLGVDIRLAWDLALALDLDAPAVLPSAGDVASTHGSIPFSSA